MSNSFNISVKPEIAALEAKVDIVDTEVDAIRATDLPTICSLIVTVDTEVDSIRGTDVVNIQANIDSNETKIDTLGTSLAANYSLIFAVKVKTDAMPQKVRGHINVARTSTVSDVFQDILNVTGQGKLMLLGVYTGNAADTLECLLTLDGVAYAVVSHTGDVVLQRLIPAMLSPTATTLHLLKVPETATEINYSNLEFDTSLLIQIRRSAGTTGSVYGKAYYFLDRF